MPIQNEISCRDLRWLFALLLFSLGFAGCQAPLDPGVEAQEQGNEARKEEPMELRSVEVYEVMLEKPARHVDAAGEMRTWDTAYMVRLGLPEPPAMGPRLDVFLGEERLGEYGGWEGGIYFWVYDSARLETLDEKPVSVSFAGAERREIGRLELGDPAELETIEESKLRSQ